MAFFYRGRALREASAGLKDAQEAVQLFQTRLEDAMAALHTQAAKAEELERVRPALEAAQQQLAAAQAARAALEAKTTAREEAMQQEIAHLTALREDMQKQFDVMANQALNTNRKAFLDLANETFVKHRQSAEADLETRRKSIQQMLEPVKDTLKRYEHGLTEVEKARQEAYGALSAELKNVAAGQQDVRSEAAKLAQAMRASPKARGRWGEHQLQNIMELCGMAEYVDFETQVSVGEGDKRLTPDAIVRLPGDRSIVIDAKASMSAYLDSLDASSDNEREDFLMLHAKQVREHIKLLAAKRYWDALENAPDYVVMFLPSDNLFFLAVEKDPQLLDFGMKQKVIIATPTTFMAIAKSIAYGWRQENMAQNAKVIAGLGQELYKRLSALGGKVAATGKHLDKAVSAYNGMVGSLEASVMPHARKFRELEVEGTGEAVAKLPLVETDARAPSQGRDLQLDTPPAATNVAPISLPDNAAKSS
ncbi:MAG: DNA recombination protein RmuC [Pseudomonadota bacterium]